MSREFDVVCSRKKPVAGGIFEFPSRGKELFRILLKRIEGAADVDQLFLLYGLERAQQFRIDSFSRRVEKDQVRVIEKWGSLFCVPQMVAERCGRAACLVGEVGIGVFFDEKRGGKAGREMERDRAGAGIDLEEARLGIYPALKPLEQLVKQR